MFNEKFNHSAKFTFNADSLPFVNLNDIIASNGNTTFTVRGVFINKKAKFGPRPCVISDTAKINLPNHFVDDIIEILATPEMVEAINNGKCGFTPCQYTDKNGVVRNSGNFGDI